MTNNCKNVIASAVHSLSGHLFNHHYDEFRKHNFEHSFPCISDEKIFAEIESIQAREDVQAELRKQLHWKLHNEIRNLREGNRVLWSSDNSSVTSYCTAILDKAFVQKELEEYNSMKEFLQNTFAEINDRMDAYSNREF